MLKAEIAYLESPKRVSGLARGELGLVPVKTGGVIELHEIAEYFPLAADQSAEVSLP